MFIGRKTELAFLNDRYNTKGGQLVVLYGRRRVGKTETLREFCRDKEHVFYSCRECPDTDQLASFSTRMLKPGMPIAQYVQSFTSWEQAFGAITELPSSGKKLLVIDEFPYMARNNSAIPSILQNLWDESLKDKDIMIILCGSAMSFIENEILAEKNPLYGRATGILKMTEMGFYDAIQFFPDYSHEDKITAYSVLGGIPHYLKQFDSDATIEENIKRHILTRGSILYSEIEFLMRQELRETALYNTIIEAVALGNTKLNDIFTKTGIDRPKLSVYIKNLIALGIMEREFSVSAGEKEAANASRGLYRLADNYFSFWYRFVFGNLSELESGDVDGVYTYSIAPELNHYVSGKFEDVCRQYIRRENMAGALPFRFEKMGRYFHKDVEIDIMAFKKDRSQLLFGECKYKNSPFEKGDLLRLQAKAASLTKQDASFYLFSKSEFSDESEAMKNNAVWQITLADLF